MNNSKIKYIPTATNFYYQLQQRTKKHIKISRVLLVVLIIWNIILTINLKQLEHNQPKFEPIQNVQSAILDYSVAEIPEYNPTSEK